MLQVRRSLSITEEDGPTFNPSKQELLHHATSTPGTYSYVLPGMDDRIADTIDETIFWRDSFGPPSCVPRRVPAYISGFTE